MKTCFRFIRKLINTCRMQLILCKVTRFISQKRKKLVINFPISDNLSNFVRDFEFKENIT